LVYMHLSGGAIFVVILIFIAGGAIYFMGNKKF